MESVFRTRNATTTSTTTATSTASVSTTSAIPSLVYECDEDSPCGCSYANVAFAIGGSPLGEEAVDHSWSMIVSLRFGGSENHSCAGTLLSNSYILTAAHCVAHFSSAEAANITALIGVTNQLDEDRYIRSVDKIHLHTNYTGWPDFVNNIAVLHMNRRLHFEYNPVIAKTCVQRTNASIPSREQPTKNGTRLVIIGWGVMEPGNPSLLSAFLQQAHIYAIDQKSEICADKIINGDLQFCAGLSDDRQGQWRNCQHRFAFLKCILLPVILCLDACLGMSVQRHIVLWTLISMLVLL